MSIDINEIRTQYKDLFEHSLDIIYVNRLDGKIIDANDIALSTLGYKREEIIDFSFGDLIDKDQLENANSAFKEIKETGQQSKLFEFRLKAKDGSFVYIETYAIPLQKNGKIYATLGIARNITDLRVVQENLKQSEEKYRFLYETTPFSVVLINSDGIIVDCNSTAETMFGFNKIELIGRHFKNISVIHQDYLPELFNLFQRIIKGEKLHRIDIQVYKKDGSLIWANLQASVLMVGGKLFVQAIFHDVTESKEITLKLEESENLYKTLVKTSPDAVIVTNMKGEIIEASQKAAELDRVSSVNDIIGRNAFNLIIPEERPKAEESLKKVLKEGSVKTEYTLIRSDGSHYIGELNTSLIKNKDGTPKAFIGIMRDITEQKNAEKLLKKSEEKYRDLYENALVGLWTIRIKDGSVIRANNIAAKIIGYKSVEDLVKYCSIPDLFAADTIKNIYRQLRSHDELSAIEIKFRDLMGNDKDISIWAKSYFEQGTIECAFIDITKFKSVQKALQESEEKYRYLFENSPNMIILLDSAGKIFDLNPTVLNSYGYEKKDFIDHDFRDLTTFPSESLSILEKIFKRVFIKGFTEPIELQFYKKDGSTTWVNLQASLIKMGGETFIQTIVQDIDKRKRAEQKLKESEEKYRIISENANDLITVINEKFRFEYINEEVHKRITGYSKEDLIGKSPVNNFHPDDIKKGVKTWRDGVISGEGTTEFRYKKKDGTWIWLEMRGKKFIDINGEPKGVIISRDITKRKIAEQKLKESEQKFRTITEQSLMGIIILQDNLIKYINEEAASMLGYTVDEVLNMAQGGFINYFHPDDRKIVIEQAKKRQKGIETKISGYRARCLKKSGEIVWIQNYSKTIKYQEKYADLITVINITDKVKAEEKLKESEQKYRHLFESSPYSIGLLDLEGTLLEGNEATNKFLSTRTKDEIIGKNFREIFSSTEQDKSLLPKLTDYIKKVIKDEIREPLEIPITRSIGGVIWISFYGSLIKMGDKTLLQFIGQDITDRKRAEQNLKKSEERYRLLFENSPNAIILANSKGIILDFNPATKNLLGYKRDEIIGTNYVNISSPSHIALMKKRYDDHLRGILLKPMEIEVRKIDGSYIWVNYQNEIIRFDEEDISISIIQDITKRKEAELLINEELIKLKELEQIRKDLISRVSHELKTPLIPVISGTELLTTIYKDQLGKDALEIIDMIDKGGARLKELVEKLINVSRIEYNKFEVRKETFNLSEIIKRSANGMKFLMEQRRLILKCEISDKLYLEIDELRMEEVITNLLSNAIKNTPPQGEINLSLQKEDNWAIIKVEDTGIGLTKKEKEVLFTRFGKIERYEKGLEDIDVKGSGLGLYICKEIISLHEGKIWAESEGRNKGSVFTVKLPIK